MCVLLVFFYHPVSVLRCVIFEGRSVFAMFISLFFFTDFFFSPCVMVVIVRTPYVYVYVYRVGILFFLPFFSFLHFFVLFSFYQLLDG